MNLYAITPDYSPDPPKLALCQTDEEAIERAVFAAARDLEAPYYGSPTATVYLVASNLPVVGIGHARHLLDKPQWWSRAPGARLSLAEALLHHARQIDDLEVEVAEKLVATLALREAEEAEEAGVA